VDPKRSLDVWRRDLIHFANRIKTSGNPAHSLVFSDELLLTCE